MTFELDRRTRRDEDRRPVGPDAFFRDVFPGLTAKNGRLVAEGLKALDVPPLSLDVDGSVWTVQRCGETIEALPRAVGGAVVVTLTPEQFSDWAQNQVSFNGLMVLRALRFEGSLTDVSAWDSLWIALLEGWAIVDPSLTFLDRQGAPLDLSASFAPQDDPADIAHFLREAGYLRLRGWLDPADMARIVEDMDRALPLYAEGDGRSWWATLSDGQRCCVRMQTFIEHSPTTQRILTGDAWGRLRKAIAGADRLANVPLDSRVIEALYKPLGVVSGPSDLPFHRDCHLGRHAYVCSRMTIGVALTPTSAANGCLRAVAGSHRLAMPVETARARPYLPVVALPTEPGDLTVHLSCTLHEATAPVFAARRVMYTEIPLAPLAGDVGAMDTSVAHIRQQVNDLQREQPAG